MPIYEYECQVCRRRFERLQHFTDGPVKTCPHCGGSVQRVIQPVGIIFRGSGFYVTDNRQLPSKEPLKELSDGDGAPKEREKTAASEGELTGLILRYN